MKASDSSSSSSPSAPVARVERSDYMHWAKTLQAARFNLGNSGLHAVQRAELPLRLEDLEYSGPSFYGWSPLIEALAQHLGVDKSRVFHAEGTSFANHIAMAVCFRPGDEVIIEQPTYELITSTAEYLGAVVKRLPRRRAEGFQPDLSALRAALTAKTRLIVLTNLHNPTSVRIPDATLRAIADLAAEANAYVLVDEVYLDADFAGAPVTAHRLSDRILTTSSLTKVYGLSGLRCGWVVAAPEITERLWRLNDLFGVIPAHAAERLSLLALREMPRLRARAQAVLEPNRARWNAFLAKRTDLLVEPLPFGTVTFPELRGGRVERLCEILRAKYETTVVPGRFFDQPESFRVGLGSPPEIFAEGLSRLGQALDDLRRE